MTIHSSLKISCLRSMKSFRLTALALTVILQCQIAIADNIRFLGTLVSQPCSIALDSENIQVDMRTVVNNDLFYGRTPETPFSITLENCNPTLAKSILATFVGVESNQLEGLIAIPSRNGNLSSGLAIGLKLSAGEPVFFNKKTNVHTLTMGENQIMLSAFIQTEPSVTSKSQIQLGPFHATTTFYLEYQ